MSSISTAGKSRPLCSIRLQALAAFSLATYWAEAGWEVELPDGSTDKYYVALPGDLQVTTTLHFDRPPITHAGQPLEDTSIEALAQHYVDYLRRLVHEATATFDA